MSPIRSLTLGFGMTAFAALPSFAMPALVYEWDAATQAGVSSSTWSDTQGVYDLTHWIATDLAANTPTPIAPIAAATAYRGLSHAFRLDGTAEFSGTQAPDIAIPDPTTRDASFEFWFKPSDLVGTEALFESGGSQRGLGFVLFEDRLEYRIVSNGALSANPSGFWSIDTQLDPAMIDDFIQVVGTLSVEQDLALYVNGTFIGSVGMPIDDWTGGNDLGFGGNWPSGGAIGGTRPLVDGGIDGDGAFAYEVDALEDRFEGDIAWIRVYDGVLTGAQIQQRFNEVVFGVPAPAACGVLLALGILPLLASKNRAAPHNNPCARAA